MIQTAAAEDHVDPATTEASSSAQQVEVTSTFDASADQRSATTARSIVSQEDMKRYGDTNLSDVLRRVPGITVVSKQGKTDVRMRGMGNGYTQILLNGDPAPQGFTIDSLSPALVERIEVIRTATADQSTQAIAGTINIILRQAPRKASRSARVAAGGLHGHLNYSLSGEQSGVIDQFSYSVSPSFAGNYTPTPTTIDQFATDAQGAVILRRRDDQDYALRSRIAEVASALKWKFDDRTALTVDPWISVRRFVETVSDERIAFLGNAPQFASDNQLSTVDQTLARVRSALHQQLFDDADLDVKLGISHSRTLGRSQFSGYDVNDRRVLDEDIHATTRMNTLTTSGKFRAPVVDGHAIEAGWDGSLGRLSERRLQTQSAPPGYPAVDLDELNNVRITRLALFVQDEWEPSKQLSFYAGVRWESLLTHASGNTLDTVDNRSAVISPIVQLVWRPPEFKDDQVRLGLSRTYKSPTPEQLNPRRHVANDNTPTTPNTSGNPALRPELAWSLDLALEHYVPAIDGVFSANVYARRIEDVTVQELSLDNGAWMSRPVNDGRATATGLEFEGKLGLQKLGEDFPKIDLRGNLAWNWSRVSGLPEPSNRIVGQTPFSATLGSDYRLPTLPLTLGTSMTLAAARSARTSFSQIETVHRSLAWDAYALWQLNEEAKLRISVVNLRGKPSVTDQAEFDSAGSFHQTTTERRPTTVRATLELKL
jgi:outer membrane receptor for ferrienterochelin and colicins